MSDLKQVEEVAPAVVVVIHSRLATVRLNRPAERNKLSLSVLSELDQSISTLIKREDLKAIVITGTEDVFTAGADIGELRALTTETALEFAVRGQRLMQQLAHAPQLTVAAINGYCMGGGLDLALACDLRVASKDAVFAHPGARLGIITGWGGTQRLPRLIGPARALEIFLTARRVRADEALEMGLVSRIGDPVLECASEIVAQRAL
ncbi:MAG TPA: enoyl-CoA hydratase/isomerase family protein [Pyrinomonadaceae bacterium]|jgi:enoyl-CoA hydratase